MFLLAALLLAQQATPVAPRPEIVVPRIEAEIEVDGRLDEAAWAQAERLTGFRQFQPADGRPAEERTEVLVWYSPRALHFGIRAYARDPRSIRATLADRDNIFADDRVLLYLDTFNDRRRAYLFGVNPLGVQLDGVRTEGAVSAASIFGGTVDYSPDFFFDSRGVVTDSGFVIEVRVPFKSLRYSPDAEQRWGLQVVRNNAASGYEDTWTDVRRASASFLAQSGTITGLRDIERGVAVEVQPFATATANGRRNATTGEFDRGSAEFSGGGNLRLGFTSITLDATVNPDFSQVESDAGLITLNERFALFIPEKRPFFLEGIELFATPNQLVYTRQIADPSGGAKLTGKVGPYSLAYLAAVDERSGADAIVNVARVRRDLFGNSIAALTVTDRERDGAYNRVAAADARLVFGGKYYLEGQLGGAWTKDADGTRSDPVWKLEFDRTGRAWGFNYQVNTIGDEFESALGFVPRTGITSAHAFNRFTRYGAPGALLENLTTFFGPNYLWDAGDLGRASRIEGSETWTVLGTLRGGWGLSVSGTRSFFRLTPDMFQGVALPLPGGSAPYAPPDELSGLLQFSASASTPIYQRFNASAGVTRGEVPIFAEGAEGRETRASAGLALRPSDDIRIDVRTAYSRITRATSGREFARTIIPRLRVEYQATRALFFRAVGEYRSQRRDASRDPVTGAPFLIGGAPSIASEGGTFRHEWLVSFEPTPGTVAFLGYISAHDAPTATSLSGLRREADGLFVKLAYQFRK